MSAEVLRRAAALMRERAEAIPREGLQDWWFDPKASDLMHMHKRDREHIASWHPAVAVAVADWLDATADARGHAIALGMGEPDRALAVARAYLEESA